MLERFLPRTEFSSYEDFKLHYKVNIPEDFNYGFDVVDAWAEQDDDKPALLWCDDHGGERSFTFGEIKRLSNKAVHFFKAQGIVKGDPVMLVLRQRWEYWICAVALHKLGAVLIPASDQLTAKDIRYRCEAASIRMIVCVADDYVLKQTEEALPGCPSLISKAIVAGTRPGWLDFVSAVDKYPDSFDRPQDDTRTHNSDLMLMYFTSGTTGMPKMAMHDFTHPLGHIVTAKYWQCVQEGKLHMTTADSAWAKFGWGKIYGQWICGAIVFAYDWDRFVPSKLLEKVSRYKVTTFCATPSHYRFMLQEDLSKYDLSSVKRAGIAGEPLNPEVMRKWHDLTGIRLHEGYGQSESSVLVANFPWFEPRPGSMGMPSPLYEIDLAGEDGESVDEGEEGEIVVRGMNEYLPTGLFLGYYNDPEITSDAMRGGSYHTGDVAWRDSDGYYWFVGRNDDVIKCSGYRIGPFEVESALLEHPAVLECAITAVPDPVRGQVVKATVVLTQAYSKKGDDALKKELQDHVKHVTAPYKYPRIVVFTDELPKNIAGKIKRAEIRESDKK